MIATVENIRLWRLRAEQLRLLAGTVDDPSARLGVLKAADSYDAIAASAEARVKVGAVVIDLPTILPAGLGRTPPR